MRIVNREEFFKLPAGVIFSEYVPTMTVGLWIKGKTIEWTNHRGELAHDFYKTSLQPTVYYAEVGITLFTLENEEGRDGAFDASAEYIVYEEHDLTELRAIIANAVSAPGDAESWGLQIVNFKEFLQLPNGVLFACHNTEAPFGIFKSRGLWMRRHTISHEEGKPYDFYMTDLQPTVQAKSDGHPEVFPFSQEDMEHEGCYDEENEYIVYGEKELKVLREIIVNAIPA